MGQTRTGFHQVESDHSEKKPKEEEDVADGEVPTYIEIWEGPRGSSPRVEPRHSTHNNVDAPADKVVKEEEEETVTAKEEPIMEEEQVPVSVDAVKVEPDEEEVLVNLENEEVQEEDEHVSVGVNAVKVEPEEEEEEVPVNLRNEEVLEENEQVLVRVAAAKIKPDEEEEKEVPVNLRNVEVDEQVPVRVNAEEIEPNEEEIPLPEEVPVNPMKDGVEDEEEEPILVEEDSCIEISDDDYSPSPLPKSRKSQALTVQSGKRKKVGRPRNQETKVGRPRKLNTEFQPKQEDYPSFKVRMEPRHLTNNNVLVPYHMVRLNLPRTLTQVTLRVGSGEWKVKFMRFTSNRTGRMSVGWLEFAEANSLEVGDVCVFKMVQTGVFQVSINDGDEYA